jgi:hypothetical protein
MIRFATRAQRLRVRSGRRDGKQHPAEQLDYRADIGIQLAKDRIAGVAECFHQPGHCAAESVDRASVIELLAV